MPRKHLKRSSLPRRSLTIILSILHLFVYCFICSLSHNWIWSQGDLNARWAHNNGKCQPPKFSDGDKKNFQFCLVSSCWLHNYEPPQKSTQEPATKMVTKGEDPPCLIRKQNMVIVTRDNKARNIFLCQNNWRVKQLPLPKVFIQFKEVISNIVEEFLSRVRSL